jgi:hypothetical protein
MNRQPSPDQFPALPLWWRTVSPLLGLAYGEQWQNSGRWGCYLPAVPETPAESPDPKTPAKTPVPETTTESPDPETTTENPDPKTPATRPEDPIPAGKTFFPHDPKRGTFMLLEEKLEQILTWATPRPMQPGQTFMSATHAHILKQGVIFWQAPPLPKQGDLLEIQLSPFKITPARMRCLVTVVRLVPEDSDLTRVDCRFVQAGHIRKIAAAKARKKQTGAPTTPLFAPTGPPPIPKEPTPQESVPDPMMDIPVSMPLPPSQPAPPSKPPTPPATINFTVEMPLVWKILTDDEYERIRNHFDPVQGFQHRPVEHAFKGALSNMDRHMPQIAQKAPQIERVGVWFRDQLSWLFQHAVTPAREQTLLHLADQLTLMLESLATNRTPPAPLIHLLVAHQNLLEYRCRRHMTRSERNPTLCVELDNAIARLRNITLPALRTDLTTNYLEISQIPLQFSDALLALKLPRIDIRAPNQEPMDGRAIVTVNLSATGVVFRTYNHELARGQYLWMTLHVPSSDHPLNLCCEIMMIKEPPQPNQRRLVACQFTLIRPEEQSRLEAWIQSAVTAMMAQPTRTSMGNANH